MPPARQQCNNAVRGTPVLVASDPVTGMAIVDSFGPIRIGDSGTDWSRFKGRIDNVTVWGDFMPVPRDATPLIHYAFNPAQVEADEVFNLVVQNYDWMRGLLVGEPDLVQGVYPFTYDRALELNAPMEFPPVVDFMEIINGDALTFTKGILVTAKILVPGGLSKFSSVIASQLAHDEASGLDHWRFAIDRVADEYFLTFKVWLLDGRSKTVAAPVPDGYAGGWVDVAATYDPSTGVVGVFWEFRRIGADELGPPPTSPIRIGADPIRIGMGWDSAATSGTILQDDFKSWTCE
jgi:hypothetical protein